ncbi:hypothetical protein J5N97_022005 [Dioscorea zingiberensis]|uniref:Uncharacterized protein n=1 Tax=Dioscorea zingiberensis TaxID=325984 RepID=A0A9D5CAC9_9LILI|nr:hypothetical protein J5N97_022005 [Dioscorea zingiberensis]
MLLGERKSRNSVKGFRHHIVFLFTVTNLVLEISSEFPFEHILFDALQGGGLQDFRPVPCTLGVCSFFEK